jgi:hypothetical protein
MFHRENYDLRHAWLVNAKPMGISVPTKKYLDVKPDRRTQLQAEWNAPLRWPLYLLLALAIAGVIPAVKTYFRERS